MGLIHVLPERVANKIAAGEVVERPASVLKELVENALDAGATAIEIEIAHGGKSLIQVSDNGCGMSREDAGLAFERHATSKISDVEDLLRVGSFGFRGEALPSIAAVSRTKLMTGRREDPTGTEISIEGGKKVPVRDCPPRQGTLIEVRDLFFNTPARRKFLKTDTTEMGHLLDTVSNLALAHLEVRFLLKSGNKILLDLLPAENPASRARSFFGEEVAKHLMEVEGETGGIRIWGVVGKPFIARGNRSGQSFFVNRRWVRSLPLSYALQDGFYGLLVHGKFPVACLFLDLDRERVDINVHPTKQEIRISNEAEVKSYLKKIVAERLMKEPDLAPHLRQKEGVFFGAGQGPEPLKRTTTFAAQKWLSAHEPTRVDSSDHQTAMMEPVSLREKFHITKILGQIHATYVVAETEEGYLLVDQHAAHERVMFEVLLKNVKSENPERQALLMDEVLELHPRQLDLFKRSLPLLIRAGFEIEPFGERAFVIRAYPAILGSQDPVSFIREFLDETEEGKVNTGLDRQTDEVAALVACKRRSVKAHDSLSSEALWTLFERLASCENPFSCPHGRPTFIQHTLPDLERQFKRK